MHAAPAAAGGAGPGGPILGGQKSEKRQVGAAPHLPPRGWLWACMLQQCWAQPSSLGDSCRRMRWRLTPLSPRVLGCPPSAVPCQTCLLCTRNSKQHTPSLRCRLPSLPEGLLSCSSGSGGGGAGDSCRQAPGRRGCHYRGVGPSPLCGASRQAGKHSLRSSTY